MEEPESRQQAVGSGELVWKAQDIPLNVSFLFFSVAFFQQGDNNLFETLSSYIAHIGLKDSILLLTRLLSTRIRGVLHQS